MAVELDRAEMDIVITIDNDGIVKSGNDEVVSND
jgi:hypothetical protein